MYQAAKSILRDATALVLGAALAASCGGFGTSNTTSPGSTPNIAAQTSFRIVGRVGTPFAATISDTRSSWNVKGVIPLNIVIINNAPPVRVSVNKLVSDSSLISLEVIHGFQVQELASSTSNFGVAVGSVDKVGGFAPAASPDVRFFVKGPTEEIFDALIEDIEKGEIVQSRGPALFLFDSPAGGVGGRVDGIFTAVSFLGGFSIDLIYNGVVVRSVLAGTNATLKFP